MVDWRTGQCLYATLVRGSKGWVAGLSEERRDYNNTVHTLVGLGTAPEG